MISKNLTRRLERLEDYLLPVMEEPLVIEVQGVDTDGKIVSTLRFTLPPGPRPAKQRFQ